MKNFIISVITACLVIGTANAVSKKLCVGVPYIKEIKLSGTQSVNLGSNQAWTVSVTSDYSNSNKAVDWSVSSGSGFASITSPTNTSATINGIKVNSDGTSSATIRAAAKDGSGLYDEKTINISCPTSGVSPANGTFSAVSPYTSNTNCRYTAPSKTISGCYSVTTNTVSYSGSSWPASTYNITANSGYYIQNNNQSNASCVSCSNSCTPGSRSCSQNCSVANASSCSYTDATESRSTACTNGTGNTSTSASCAAYANCGGGTIKSVTCSSGYTVQNNNTSSASCVSTCPTGNSISSKLSSVCNDNFICKGCGEDPGYTWSGGTTTQTVSADGCTSPTPYTVYGQSKCSTTNDPGYGGDTSSSVFRPVSFTVSDSAGQYCWCRICASSTISDANCGAWVLATTYSSYEDCGKSDANGARCPGTCVSFFGKSTTIRQNKRKAACKAP